MLKKLEGSTRYVFAVILLLATGAVLFELRQYSVSFQKQDEEVVVLQISRRPNDSFSKQFSKIIPYDVNVVEGETNSVAKESIETLSVTVDFPPVCTPQQLDVISHQLPPGLCQANQKQPWNNLCSFSFATSCPETVWIDEYYEQTRTQRQQGHLPFVAVYVGCNKGMDAVNALRMGSGNPNVDKFRWRDEFFTNATNVKRGVCKQEFSEQFPIHKVTSRSGNSTAVVHCLEAMPRTAAHLQQTASRFDWEHEKFIVKNAAFSSADGVTRFSWGAVGGEKTSICNAQQKNCKEVPLLRLDTYMNEQNATASNEMIDLLSIDVEGFDAEVLLGANSTLERVRYLEFEYNWRGKWPKHPLQNIIKSMRDRGFVCYWPGMRGHIWRITDCWLDHYKHRFWSNVACVHLERHPLVSKRMEELFLQTLAQNRSIQYTERTS